MANAFEQSIEPDDPLPLGFDELDPQALAISPAASTAPAAGTSLLMLTDISSSPGKKLVALKVVGLKPPLEYALSGADTWQGISTGIWGGRYHPARAYTAALCTEGGSGMTHAHRTRRRQRAMAARQALSLCEAELLARPRISALLARSALRAAGLPPHLAARLRGRLRLVSEQEGER